MAIIITWTQSALQTSNYTASLGELVLCDPSGGAFTVMLPTAVGHLRMITIKNTTSSTNTITIDGNSTETIDGSLTVSMNTAYQSVTMVSDNANWWIL